MKGKKVIELGPGRNSLAKKLFEKYGIAEYVAVEPVDYNATDGSLDTKNKRVSMSNKDALEYLLEQPNESAIVISFGVMNPELLTPPLAMAFLAVEYPHDAVMKEVGYNYYGFLGREIFRVTPKDAISIHGFNVGTADVDLYFVKPGFRPVENNCHQDASSQSISWNILWIK